MNYSGRTDETENLKATQNISPTPHRLTPPVNGLYGHRTHQWNLLGWPARLPVPITQDKREQTKEKEAKVLRDTILRVGDREFVGVCGRILLFIWIVGLELR